MINIFKCFFSIGKKKKKRISYDQQLIMIAQHRRLVRSAVAKVEQVERKLEKARLDGEEGWPCNGGLSNTETDDPEGKKTNGRISMSVSAHCGN